MKYFISLSCVILLSCGGGGGIVAPNPDPGSSSTRVSGLSGSISDIEIIDVD